MIRFAVVLVALLPAGAIAQEPALRPPPARPCAFPDEASGGPVNAHTRAVATRVGLVSRMRALGVPGVSVAVVHDGQLDWARGWGVRDAETCAPVTARTRFQAASISKTVTAAITLRLAERGLVDLDAPVSRYLRQWRVPDDAPGITLRELLAHTAGIGVHGFAGYPVGAPVPALPQILDGAPPANNPPIRPIAPPHAAYAYSGGGYEIIEAALEDATGMPFSAIARDTLFTPLGMVDSDFSQPPDVSTTNAAASGHAFGRVMRGRFRIYPERAAAGLWTTPADLARLYATIQSGGAGLLDPRSVAAMLTPVTAASGLGIELDVGQGRFGHAGANAGYRAAAWFVSGGGDGVVVMTNAESGATLADEIVRAVALDYGWPAAGQPVTRSPS